MRAKPANSGSLGTYVVNRSVILLAPQDVQILFSVQRVLMHFSASFYLKLILADFYLNMKCLLEYLAKHHEYHDNL